MATGNYGTVRPADVSVDDVEILYSYSPSREDINDITLLTLDPNQVLIPAKDPNNTVEVLGGLYTLKLPTATFGSVGFYSIIIRPKQIRTTISDCGNLTDMPDIKGLVFDTSTIPTTQQNRFNNGQLVGYRVEYLDDLGNKIPNKYRIITSNNYALVVAQPSGNNNATQSYSYDDNSTLTFCTVTPSSAPFTNPNEFPFIGNPGQNVIITNTFFDPIMLDVEMVEHNDETLSYALYSNQSKSLEDGIYTIYNYGDEIYKQYNLFEIKDEFTGKPLYEVREKRTTIDPTKEFNNIV